MTKPLTHPLVERPAIALGRPSAADAARLSGRILDAAQRIFLSTGYAEATMDGIAEAAGTSRKTLYARYSSKSEVLAAVADRLLDGVLGSGPKESRPSGPARDPRLVLLRLARELAALAQSPQVAGLNRLIMAEGAQVPQLAKLSGEISIRTRDSVKSHLDTLQAAGHIGSASNLDRAAMIFIEMISAIPGKRANLGQPMPRKELDALLSLAVDIFIGGIVVVPRPNETLN